MQVTYLGHAAILLESGGTRILMDPWLTDPTYHGTWWHYPPLELGVRDLPRIDYLYVSHEHPDHFDPPTLAQLDKDMHVVIANYPAQALPRPHRGARLPPHHRAAISRATSPATAAV